MTRDEIVRSLSERWRFSIAEDSSLWSDVGAALRERDALHAVELEHTRAYAIREAARLAEECWHGPGDHGCHHGRAIAESIRALLEEAGK